MKAKLVFPLVVGLALVAALLVLLPWTSPAEALDITDTPGGSSSATPGFTATPTTPTNTPGGPTNTPTNTPTVTPTFVPGTLPVQFGIAFEQYDPADGTWASIVQSQMDAVPYKVWKFSNTTGWGYWPVNTVDLVTKWTVNMDPFGFKVISDGTPDETFYHGQFVFQAVFSEPNCLVAPYQGPVVSVVLTDTVVGPTVVWENRSFITIRIRWNAGYLVRQDTGIQPGEIVTGPVGLWRAEAYAYPDDETSTGCWFQSWDLRAWEPAPPTPTPTPTPTDEPPTPTPTNTPSATPTATPTLEPPSATPTNTPTPTPTPTSPAPAGEYKIFLPLVIK